MSRIKVKLLGTGTCRAIHNQYNVSLSTSKSKELDGKGNAFSSTDLISAALGTCIGSSIDMILVREGINLANVEIEVEKELEVEKRTIACFNIIINIHQPITERLNKLLMNAANTCMVKRSLSGDIMVRIKVAASNQ